MRFTIFNLLFICFLFVPAGLLSQNQDITFEHLSVDQGLSQSTATAILQDEQGFMWFGTQDGLNKYDGYSFTTYRHDAADSTSLSINFISALLQGESGTLWIGTQGGGLNRCDVHREVATHFWYDPGDPHSLSSNRITTLYRDRSGTVWVGTSFGLNRLIHEESGAERDIRFDRFYVPDSTAQEAHWINALYEDSRNNLWVATGSGLYHFNRQNETFSRFRFPQQVSAPVSSILEDGSGNLWFGTAGAGIIRLSQKDDSVAFFRHEPGNPASLSHNDIKAIFEDRRGKLWFGTAGGGLNLYKGAGSFQRFVHDPYDSKSLSNNVILSFHEDTGGGLWIGTGGGGVNVFDPLKEKFVHLKSDIRNPDALRGNFVWSIFEDRKQNLWIGTQSGGLNRYDRRTGEFTVYAHSPSDPATLISNQVYCVTADSDGMLWIGTDRGLDCLNPRTETFRHHTFESTNAKGLHGQLVRTLFVDEKNTLWIGTHGGGLFKFDRETEQFEAFEHDPEDRNSLSSNAVRSIAQDQAGNLWLATTWGVNKFNPQTERFTRFQHNPDRPNSLSSNQVLTLCISDGDLWIGTFHGLNRMNLATEQFEIFSTEDGLPNDVIYGILSDDRGNIWVSTNGGLSKFDPASKTFSNYDIDDGLQSREFNSGACFKNKNGVMFFGGVNGLNIFHPDSVRNNPNIPPVAITEFRLFDNAVHFDRAISELGQIRLSHDEDFISFEFAALNYTNSDKNQYAYKLEGFNQDWIYCGDQRIATFTNLDPGEYVFRVKGANNDGVWNEDGAAVRIVIAPPFWQTAWFRLLMAGVAVFSFVGFIYLFNRRQKQKAELNNRITELKLKALRAQMNPHFIFNTINSIQYYISNNEQNSAYKYLSKFSRLMRKTLDNSEKSTLTIAEELEALQLYLELESVRFEGKFQYEIEVDPNIDIYNVEIPTLLIQPFVENAIQHGLRFKRSKGALTISLQQGRGEIVCTIRDNGIGIQKALAAKPGPNEQHKSTALKVSCERLQTMNALRRNGRGVEIVDLSQQYGRQGTEVKIVIPIGHE